MLIENNSTQQALEMVYIENLVPQDHLLRKIDKYINFSFIKELTKDLYCPDNGGQPLTLLYFLKCFLSVIFLE